jgi:hypothetical protein
MQMRVRVYQSQSQANKRRLASTVDDWQRS